MRFSRSIMAMLATIVLVAAASQAQDINLLALGEGALPVAEAPCYSGWTAVKLLDDSPKSGWANAPGLITNNVFVFELVAPAVFVAFEFDAAGIDGNARGA